MNNLDINRKRYLLKLLISYRSSMSEFYEEDMDYFINLVEKDIVVQD